jgi:hypothetical protein
MDGELVDGSSLWDTVRSHLHFKRKPRHDQRLLEEQRKEEEEQQPKASSSFEKENLKLWRRFHGEGKLKACF